MLYRRFTQLHRAGNKTLVFLEGMLPFTHHATLVHMGIGKDLGQPGLTAQNRANCWSLPTARIR